MGEEARMLFVGAAIIAGVSGIAALWAWSWLPLVINGWTAIYLLGAFWCWENDREDARRRERTASLR